MSTIFEQSVMMLANTCVLSERAYSSKIAQLEMNLSIAYNEINLLRLQLNTNILSSNDLSSVCVEVSPNDKIKEKKRRYNTVSEREKRGRDNTERCGCGGVKYNKDNAHKRLHEKTFRHQQHLRDQAQDLNDGPFHDSDCGL